MRTKYFAACLLLLFYSMNIFSQSKPYTLKINISGLKNSTGVIALQLADKDGNIVEGKTAEIANNSSQIKLDSLKQGIYTIRYFHDENSNNQLDCNWMGIPVEGYGFSNNATARFGSPPLEDQEFELKNDLTMDLRPKY